MKDTVALIKELETEQCPERLRDLRAECHDLVRCYVDLAAAARVYLAVMAGKGFISEADAQNALEDALTGEETFGGR